MKFVTSNILKLNQICKEQESIKDILFSGFENLIKKHDELIKRFPDVENAYVKNEKM